MFTSHTYLLCMYKEDLTLNNLKWLICNKTKPNQAKLKKYARNREYPTETIMGVDYADDIALLANTPAQAKSLLPSLEQATGDIGLYMNANKTEYMSFNQEGAISTVNCGSLKLVD